MKKKSKSKNNQTGQVISDGERKIEVQTRNYEKQQNTAQKPFRDKIKAERQSKEINSRKLYTPEEKKNPIIQKFINSVEEFLLRELYIPDGSELLIAVSGGVDSCVLLDIIANISVNHKYILNVAHYNHGLRGSDSDSDENFVGKIAAEYNIPFHHSKGKVKQYAKKNALCIEHAARVLRYIFLERTSGMLKAEYVATAHTADDLAETFFINLFRGSGLTGLAAIPSKRLMSKTVKLIRPLIKMKKKDIIEYAKLRNLKWREDYTNAMVNFTRNRIRAELMPKLAQDYNPAIVDVINRTAHLLQSADAFIHEYVRTAYPRVIIQKASNRVDISIPILQTFDGFIQGEILQTVLSKHFQIQPLSLGTIDRLLALAANPVGSQCEIGGSLYALKDREIIIIARRQTDSIIELEIEKISETNTSRFVLILKEVKKKQVKYTDDPNIEYFDFDMLPLRLWLRQWKPGDNFQPLGMLGSMKISDFLINNKIPLIDKQSQLVLATKTEIVWVCGKRISEKFKVNNLTERILRAEIIEKDEQ